MVCRKKLKLTWFLVYFIVSGCVFVPKIEENQNENCELITKSMTIENEVKYSGGCEGRCEDSSIQEEINKLYKKTFAAGGYILKTSDDFMNWIKGNDQTDSRTKE